LTRAWVKLREKNGDLDKAEIARETELGGKMRQKRTSKPGRKKALPTNFLSTNRDPWDEKKNECEN